MSNKKECVYIGLRDSINDFPVLNMSKQGSGKAVYLKDIIDEYKKYYDNLVVMDMKKEDLLSK